VLESISGLRAVQVQAFAELAAKEEGAVVIAGDTNVVGLSPLFHRFLSPFQDGFRDASWGFGYTFPTNRRPWMRIDRILASDHLHFVGFEVGTSKASDHLAVVADLEPRHP
jgi:endonuclease/exonuclease/phosphatase family metal-dependent hydrolase